MNRTNRLLAVALVLLLALYLTTVRSAVDGYTARVVATSASGAAAATSSLLTNLVSWWTMDEASGATRAGFEPLTDHGTVTQEAGHIVNSAGFNGTNQWLSHVSDSGLDTGDVSFSFAAWIYLGDHTDFRTVASKGATTPTVEWTLFTDEFGTLTAQSWDDPPSAPDAISSSVGAIAVNTWTHVVFIRDKDGGLLRLYVGGVAVTPVSITKTPVAHAGDFEVGRYAALGTRYWKGRIDGAGFWKRAITEAEIAVLYNAGVGKDYPF